MSRFVLKILKKKKKSSANTVSHIFYSDRAVLAQSWNGGLRPPLWPKTISLKNVLRQRGFYLVTEHSNINMLVPTDSTYNFGYWGGLPGNISVICFRPRVSLMKQRGSAFLGITLTFTSDKLENYNNISMNILVRATIKKILEQTYFSGFLFNFSITY